MDDLYNGATCSYYGSLEDVKPKHGVHHMILDEYTNKMVDKHVERFRKNIATYIASFKKEALSEIPILKDKIKALKDENASLYTRIVKLAKETQKIAEKVQVDFTVDVTPAKFYDKTKKKKKPKRRDQPEPKEEDDDFDKQFIEL